MSQSATEWSQLRDSRMFFYVAVVVSLIHIVINMTGWISGFWPNVIHFIGFAWLCVGWYVSKDASKTLKAFNYALAAAATAATLWLFFSEDIIYERGLHLSWADWLAGCVVVLSSLELTRRMAGWLIPTLIIIALGYVAWWGQYLPGVFRFSGLSLETIMFRSLFGDDGMFGSIATISSSFVMMFILFGAFLVRSGAGDFIIDLAKRSAGKMHGGPGLIAVIASGLTGTISGSAVANTASTGVITIPLMKKAGYSPRFSAGVEAAASTGGQLMPPIMGAGAFVMANYTQIPYTDIVVVSFLPALLYFLTIAAFVRLQAKKEGLKPIEEDNPEPLSVLMKRGGYSFLIPIILLIGLLIWGLSPTYAAGFAILAVIASSWLTPNRMGVAAICEALALGAKNMVMTALLLISVGLIVNVVATTGIGNTFSFMIVQWAGGQLWIAIVLIALASLVLGMGLPVTAAYIMVATIAAPALQQLILQNQLVDLLVAGQLPETARVTLQFMAGVTDVDLSQPIPYDQAAALVGGISRDILPTLLDVAIAPEMITLALLSAHMIIFWLSQDSNVTPPVCLTAFTAAAIAKTSPMSAGLSAWSLAKALYIVPFLFAYTPFLSGDWGEALQIFVFSAFGLYAFAGVFVGWLGQALNPIMRLLVCAAALLLLWPLSLWWHLGGLGMLIALRLFNRSRSPSGGAPLRQAQ
ncbi:TRAP transporter fused permease subunit [Hahella sp. KA22]|uniref:TRAP transporter permease n=1 Tax=Hahella sp. KA22 TaxID=1628392 RepID=UPI000FDF478A|nr:TRAP transporter fused permease subunit [Hahella sp. KA22]AZZ90373.1 TRAP transporter fused permease subunit [Hahella sp. KA22]QAY53743.1 TRAP transporter fused permease subunit [Hahella sp. KA22]